MDTTKHTFGSAKRKTKDATRDAHGMAQEEVDRASQSTKQGAESARQKLNQAAGEAEDQAKKVRIFVFSSPLHETPDVCVPDLNGNPPGGHAARNGEVKHRRGARPCKNRNIHCVDNQTTLYVLL